MNAPHSFLNIDQATFEKITRILFQVAANVVTPQDQRDAKEILGTIKAAVIQAKPGNHKAAVRPVLSPIRHTKKRR